MVVILWSVSILIAGCGNSQERIEKVQYEKVEQIAGDHAKEYYVGTTFFTDYAATLNKYILNIYMPKNEEAYLKAQDNMAKLMTAACYKNFSESLAHYNERNDWRTSIVDIQYGLSDWQDTQSTKLCYDIKMQKGEDTRNFYLEFTLNDEGIIHQFDIW